MPWHNAILNEIRLSHRPDAGLDVLWSVTEHVDVSRRLFLATTYVYLETCLNFGFGHARCLQMDAADIDRRGFL